jgi:hypothetical protein
MGSVRQVDGGVFDSPFWCCFSAERVVDLGGHYKKASWSIPLERLTTLACKSSMAYRFHWIDSKTLYIH